MSLLGFRRCVTNSLRGVLSRSKRGAVAVEPYYTELGLKAKLAGETDFATRSYGRAHKHYSEALCEAKLDELSHPVRRAHAILRCNRALCSLQMRRFAAALEDAREAVPFRAGHGGIHLSSNV